ncbi:Asp23/Gls24 family envelope stress response protein [Micromonospora fulviviridis]|uniref:Asp23/Gls24 family envelope stress response protein n=1 Tax=Micromonospora fulviviridis TaxID=47860 RepID=A0ABV2VXE3_9ACTN
MTGILPRRATAPPAPAPDRPAAPAPAPDGPAALVAGVARGRAPWSEERLAGLAEEAARRTGAVSDPVATVRVDGAAARVDLDLVVEHGAELTAVAGVVRRRVAARIEAYAGLTVESVTVTVVGLRLPAEAASPTGGDRPPRRDHARGPGPGTDAREAT